MMTTGDSHSTSPVLPKVRLDFYESAVVMTRFESGRVATYPVSVHDVAQACAGVELSTGLLPVRTLFWKRQGNTTTLGIYVPARRWPVQLVDGGSLSLPLPPFIFVGSGVSYYVYALKQPPRRTHIHLWHMPCPNVHANGAICPGNARFPTCSADTIEQALRLFLAGSQFNGDLATGKCQAYPDDVRRLWRKLDGKQRFPLLQLAPMRLTLSQLLSSHE